MIPHISHQSLRLNIIRVRNGNSRISLSFTHNHIVRGDVGVAEAGDVGLAGVDVHLVRVLIHLTHLTILRDCLLAFLPETLKDHQHFYTKYKSEKETVLTGLTTKSIIFIIVLVCFST